MPRHVISARASSVNQSFGEYQVTPSAKGFPACLFQQNSECEKSCLIHTSLVHVTSSASRWTLATLEASVKFAGVGMDRFEEIAIWKHTPSALRQVFVVRCVDVILRVPLRGILASKEYFVWGYNPAPSRMFKYSCLLVRGFLLPGSFILEPLVCVDLPCIQLISRDGWVFSSQWSISPATAS